MLLIALCSAIPAAAGAAQTSDERAASVYFESTRSSPPLLRAFLAQMPKGADLHNHVTGAVYAESVIAWARADGDCINEQFSFSPPPCSAPQRPVADLLAADPSYRDRLIEALSMRNFVPVTGESGHDHFFATFGRSGAVFNAHRAESLAEDTRLAAGDNVSYVEFMYSLQDTRLRTLATNVPFHGDVAAGRAALDAQHLPDLVTDAIRGLDQLEAGRRTALGCSLQRPPAACSVTVRYIEQVIRTEAPAVVFAQTLFGFELAARDPRVVGINYVAPEDWAVAVADYALHMRIVGALHRQFPTVGVTLHAGELTPGLVPPETLRNHIRDAVEVAGASRIGHGVDVLNERDPRQLLGEMQRKHVLVEIALTSNDVILGVRGADHPLPAYLKAGVPIALATDDEGVSRSDLTTEFMRAALTYHFSYATLKRFARNSIEYAFIPGGSLWATSDYRRPVTACATIGSATCRSYLAANARARMQAALEGRFASFEAGYRGRRTL